MSIGNLCEKKLVFVLVYAWASWHYWAASREIIKFSWWISDMIYYSTKRLPPV